MKKIKSFLIFLVYIFQLPHFLQKDFTVNIIFKQVNLFLLVWQRFRFCLYFSFFEIVKYFHKSNGFVFIIFILIYPARFVSLYFPFLSTLISIWCPQKISSSAQ